MKAINPNPSSAKQVFQDGREVYCIKQRGVRSPWELLPNDRWELLPNDSWEFPQMTFGGSSPYIPMKTK